MMEYRYDQEIIICVVTAYITVYNLRPVNDAAIFSFIAAMYCAGWLHKTGRSKCRLHEAAVLVILWQPLTHNKIDWLQEQLLMTYVCYTMQVWRQNKLPTAGYDGTWRVPKKRRFNLRFNRNIFLQLTTRVAKLFWLISQRVLVHICPSLATGWHGIQQQRDLNIQVCHPTPAHLSYIPSVVTTQFLSHTNSN